MLPMITMKLMTGMITCQQRVHHMQLIVRIYPHRHVSHNSFLRMMLKHRSQKGKPSLWKKLGSSNGRSQPYYKGKLIDGARHGTEEIGLTSHTKQPQHHFTPNASTACIPSRMLFLHLRHLGIRRRTWHASQYGWPRYTVKPTSSASLSP